MHQKLRIGDIAARADVSVDTVRYYEGRGLIPPGSRHGSGGYRHYDPGVIECIRFIKQAQSLGFTLDDARELVALRDAPSSVCGDIRGCVETKLRVVDEKIAELQAAREQLAALASSCGSVDEPASHCPIVEAMEQQ